MTKQLQGIAFILFGCLLLLFGIADPWFPILNHDMDEICPLLGLVFGIVGLSRALNSPKDEH
ncbi:MAG: hypothetical protein ACOX7N_04845 [Lawsonibacter sp.]